MLRRSGGPGAQSRLSSWPSKCWESHGAAAVPWVGLLSRWGIPPGCEGNLSLNVVYHSVGGRDKGGGKFAKHSAGRMPLFSEKAHRKKQLLGAVRPGPSSFLF